jgi:hypothetical protein
VTTTPDPPVIYHGYRNSDGMGAALIAAETEDGTVVGQVAHLPRHSPTGMNWGYGGSGPADCARSLLIAALGPHAACLHCRGTGKQVVVSPEGYEPWEAPYDPDNHQDDEPIVTCWGCGGDGYRVRPEVYQRFKWEFVAGWGDEWRMSRADILAWARARDISIPREHGNDSDRDSGTPEGEQR